MNLFKQITQLPTLEAAWQAVQQSGKAGGIDRESVLSFAENAPDQLLRLQENLLAGAYVPEPYMEVRIPKDDGEFRTLGLPTIRDKIVQYAAKQVLEPLLEPQFSNASYGYRPNKGPLKAIRRVRHLLGQEKKTWLAACDIDAYFDSIDRDLLFELLEPAVQDPDFLALLRLWTGMGRVSRGFEWTETTLGTPQGSVISPLLANWYLNGFDHFLTSRQYGLVRYADDFVILCPTEETARRALEEATAYLTGRLKLRLNEGAKVMSAGSGFAFLGMWFQGAKATLRREKMTEIENRFFDALLLHEGKVAQGFAQAVQGVRAYYGAVLEENDLQRLDMALLRAMYRRLCSWRDKGQLPEQEGLKGDFARVEFFSVMARRKAAAARRRLFHCFRIDNPEGIQHFFRPKAQEAREAGESQVLETREIDPAQTALRKIRKQQETYRRKAALTRELLVNTPGVFLGKSQGRLVVRLKGKSMAQVPFAHLDQITVQAEGVSFSSDVVKACMDKDIAIHFLDASGQPYAVLIDSDRPTMAHGAAQFQAYENGKAEQAARQFAAGKLRNQMALVKYLAKSGKRSKPALAAAAEGALLRMELALEQLLAEDPGQPLAALRGALMAHEGRAASAYWDFFKEALAEKAAFPGRKPREATDIVNMALNYGYGILYARVQNALSRAGLYLHLAYLHSPTEAQRPSLAFDLIEEFRPQAVDRVVYAWLRREGPMKVEKDFLSPDQRSALARRVVERLSRPESFDGHELPLEDHIHRQARQLGAFLRGEIPAYKPYVGTW